MSKKTGKSKEALNYLTEKFSNVCFTFEEARDFLLQKGFNLNKQTVAAMKKKGYLIEENGEYSLGNNDEYVTTSDAMSDWTKSHRKAFVCENDSSKTGVGDFFTMEDLEAINNCYAQWKLFNEQSLIYGCRRLNLPELLTEGLASALLEMPRTNNVPLKNIGESADLVDLVTGAEVQIKGISTTGDEEGGPTSFGPRTEFGRFIVVHVKTDEDMAYFYELDAKEYKTWKVNKKETIEDQQMAGKRPRVTILPILKKENIQPFMVYSYKTGDIKRYDKNN